MSISSGAVEYRHRHRLTLLPSPILADPPQQVLARRMSKKSSPSAWSSVACAAAASNSSLLCARKRLHPIVHAWFFSQRSVTARDAHSAEDWPPPCFVQCQAVEGAVKDGAGKSGARLRLDAALEAAEDGHVAGLQVRRASWRDEAQHDVRESASNGCQCAVPPCLD